MKRAIFLDRDGVLNLAINRERKPYPPRNVSEVVILPGVEKALQLLRTAKFELVVVTNQPDVSRGTSTMKEVNVINTYISNLLNLENFFICYHDDSDQCDCRKPKPGLLMQAAINLDIELTASYMVGDRWRDIAAGQEAGCKSYFIDYKYD
ncbi:MAG: HAD-IIIA family hydrolase, partial [Actinobacteria bacterium]|nr:HAD-IIIA family hydrolase [Actinomycetota bacterium]